MNAATSPAKIRSRGVAKKTKVAKKKVRQSDRRRAATPAASAAPGKDVRAGSKTAVVKTLLLSDAGTTTAEILKATGWPSVSVPQMARACGLALRTEKAKGEPTRYFGSVSDRAAA